MAIARKCISLIHVAKARLGLTDDLYRKILLHYGGVASSRDLDHDGFALVMEAFDLLGFKSDFKRANFGTRPGMATARQVALIRELWAEYTDGDGTEASLGKWLERTFKVSSLRFVTAPMAPKAITALKRMKVRKSENLTELQSA